jgi:hypothetical protein
MTAENLLSCKMVNTLFSHKHLPQNPCLKKEYGYYPGSILSSTCQVPEIFSYSPFIIQYHISLMYTYRFVDHNTVLILKHHH